MVGHKVQLKNVIGIDAIPKDNDGNPRLLFTFSNKWDEDDIKEINERFKRLEI